MYPVQICLYYIEKNDSICNIKKTLYDINENFVTLRKHSSSNI